MRTLGAFLLVFAMLGSGAAWMVVLDIYPPSRSYEHILLVILVTSPLWGLGARQLMRWMHVNDWAYTPAAIMCMVTCLAWCVAAAFYANAAYDRSMPETHVVMVKDKKEVRHRRGKAYYALIEPVTLGYLPVPLDWSDPLWVSVSTYNTLIPEKTQTVVTIRNGWLGIPWFESYKVLDTRPKAIAPAENMNE